MAGYTYTTFVSAVQTMIVSQAPDLPFDTILPSAIDYAEQRIYRELNLLNTVITDTSTTTTPGSRAITIPDTFVVVNDISIFTPAGTSTSNGERRQLVSVSRSVLDALWPSSTTQGEPDLFSMTTQWTMVLGPCPDAAYTVEVVGTTRPAALSALNPTTFLSERLPDVFFAAAMVFFALYQRNFSSAQGQSGNDPLMSGNWEAQYQAHVASAATEEALKHFWGSAWTSQPQPPQASPPRG